MDLGLKLQICRLCPLLPGHLLLQAQEEVNHTFTQSLQDLPNLFRISHGEDRSAVQEPLSEDDHQAQDHRQAEEVLQDDVWREGLLPGVGEVQD